MANRGNHTGKLYIRSKTGYRKPPKRLINLSEGENYQLFWYEGKLKKSKAVGRYADAAQVALINKEAELRKASVTGTVTTSVVVKSEPTVICLRACFEYDEGKNKKKGENRFFVFTLLHQLLPITR